ncbi:MAG: 3-oxoacyl-ACP reductase FabG [Planctomycetota bacterium]
MTTNRRVLVTGASRGIGRACAVALARSGFEVAVHYGANRAAALEVVSAIESAGGRACAVGFDVTDRDATAAALADEVERGGAFWGVVTSAGVTADAPFAGMDGEAWDRVLRTNLDGFFNTVKPLVMPMVGLRSGGRVVAMSSVTGLLGNAGQVNYAASKAGLVGAVKSLAKELAKRRIAVNAVAPGFVETDMTAGIDDAVVKERVPMRRMGTVEEVAALVVYLFSDAAEYLTGQALAIDGGMS